MKKLVLLALPLSLILAGCAMNASQHHVAPISSLNKNRAAPVVTAAHLQHNTAVKSQVIKVVAPPPQTTVTQNQAVSQTAIRVVAPPKSEQSMSVADTAPESAAVVVTPKPKIHTARAMPVEKMTVAKPWHSPVSHSGWQLPTEGRIVSTFSEASNTSQKGIEFAGQLGQPVYSAKAGTVVYTGADLSGHGKMIIIRHAADYISVYGNLQTVAVHEDQPVAAGLQIATMGAQHNQKATLYFAIRDAGTPVNPMHYLPSLGA